MGRVAGFLDDLPGFPYTPPGVDVLEGGKLTSNNVVGSSHNPLQSCSLYNYITAHYFSSYFFFMKTCFRFGRRKLKKVITILALFFFLSRKRASIKKSV